MSDRSFSLSVWTLLSLITILALALGAGRGSTSFTVAIPSTQTTCLDRSTWSSAVVRPIYRLQKVTVNGQNHCLQVEGLDSGYVDSVNWESGRVRVNVTTTASLSQGDAMLWVFSTTPNQPHLVVPFSQEGVASGIDYPGLMSTPYCP